MFWSSRLWFGFGLTTQSSKKNIVKKPFSKQPWITFGEPEKTNEIENWKNKEIKVATWNALSLYRTGVCQNLTNVLNKYHVKIAALQKIR